MLLFLYLERNPFVSSAPTYIKRFRLLEGGRFGSLDGRSLSVFVPMDALRRSRHKADLKIIPALTGDVIFPIFQFQFENWMTKFKQMRNRGTVALPTYAHVELLQGTQLTA